MKIEIGKTYKSNIASFTLPGGEPVPEKWIIQTSYFCAITGKIVFLGRHKRPDGDIMLREFDECGLNGKSCGGYDRQLLPNTKTVVQWGLVQLKDKFFYPVLAGYDNTAEGATKYHRQLATSRYTVGFVTYEVEES